MAEHLSLRCRCHTAVTAVPSIACRTAGCLRLPLSYILLLAAAGCRASAVNEYVTIALATYSRNQICGSRSVLGSFHP